MKCPFRKVKDRLKSEQHKYHNTYHTNKEQSVKVSIDFEDCYEQECMAFINKGACSLIVNRKGSMYEKEV